MCTSRSAHLLFTTFFFFNDTATTEIYTLSLHDALPISTRSTRSSRQSVPPATAKATPFTLPAPRGRPRHCDRPIAWPTSLPDRKSTRLNSSHGYISYAVFCLKKKKQENKTHDGLLIVGA